MVKGNIKNEGVVPPNHFFSEMIDIRLTLVEPT